VGKSQIRWSESGQFVSSVAGAAGAVNNASLRFNAMPDMLVNLQALPNAERSLSGITIRRATAYEITPVLEFVRANFSVAWADEISVGFSRLPVSVFIATSEGRVIGFCAHECTRRGFLGPMGVAESQRKKGIGAALLLASLTDLKSMGYAYAIIGGAGPTEFYAKECGATIIPGSAPGIYTDRLRKE
jgi:predicted N-acetyltransferase YhbS